MQSGKEGRAQDEPKHTEAVDTFATHIAGNNERVCWAVAGEHADAAIAARGPADSSGYQGGQCGANTGKHVEGESARLGWGRTLVCSHEMAKDIVRARDTMMELVMVQKPQGTQIK